MPLAAGTRDGQPPAQERPAFRISTRLVEVSVIVTDRKKQPVTGLTAADFRIFDQGQEQRVDLFSVESGAQTRAATSASAPAREFSNRLEGRTGGATAILFDRLNTRADDQIYARGQIVKFLEQIRAEDRIGIYVLDGDMVRVLHDFTSDASSLVRAISRLRGVTSTELAATETPVPDAPDTGLPHIDAEMAKFLGIAHERTVEHFAGVSADATMTALESIANHLAGVRGRKNLIWVSSGFPLAALGYRDGIQKQLNRARRALNGANVAIYAVDTRGLIGAFASPPGSRQPVFTTLSSVRTNLDVLETIAEETGGRAFSNTNDIRGAVRRAVNDARETYVLGYYPSHGTWDNKYRQIRVRVARSGVEIRHRQGYIAASTLKTEDAQRASSLAGAIRSPLDASALGLTARVDRVEGSSSEVHVAVRLDPGAVTLERIGDEWDGAVDVVIAQIRPDGTVVESFDKTVSLRVSAERFEQMVRGGFTMHSNVAVLPDVQRLRIVVRDVATGTVGSVVVPGEKLRAIAAGSQ